MVCKKLCTELFYAIVPTLLFGVSCIHLSLSIIVTAYYSTFCLDYFAILLAMYTIISIQMDSSHVNVNFTHFILVFESNKVLHV